MSYSNGWPIRCLGELAENQDSRRVPLKESDREQRHGEYPYYGASGVIDQVDDYLFDGDFLLIGEDGANLLARSSPIAFLASGRFWVNNHAHILSFNGHADLRYLARFLEATDLKKYVTGTAQPKLTRSNLDRIPVPLPPLPEQRRIAAILDKVDGIRCKREEGVRLTEELLHSTFLEMFGDPTTNPKGWEIVSLGSITNLVTSGLTPTGGSTVYVDEGPIFIRSQNVLMNRLDLSDVACLPIAIHESMSRTKVANGDVLLNITGASIGRVSWVDELPGEANVNQHVCIVRLQENKATPEFISVFISLPFGQRQIDNMQSGASRQGLNHQQVRALKIPLPPLKLQQRFRNVVSKLRVLIREREQGHATSDELFNSLVQRAFRGELTNGEGK